MIFVFLRAYWHHREIFDRAKVYLNIKYNKKNYKYYKTSNFKLTQAILI